MHRGSGDEVRAEKTPLERVQLPLSVRTAEQKRAGTLSAVRSRTAEQKRAGTTSAVRQDGGTKESG